MLKKNRKIDKNPEKTKFEKKTLFIDHFFVLGAILYKYELFNEMKNGKYDDYYIILIIMRT